MNDTFKIIGADGREYGPVTLEELLAWVGEGRIARQTQIWRYSVGEWRPASELPELQPLLSSMPKLPQDGGGELLVPVGFWIRFCAYWLDQILLGTLMLVALPKVFFHPIDPANLPPLRELIDQMLVSQSIGLAISGVYYVVMTAHFGATLGKLVFGARVVQLDGSPVGYKVSLFRFLGSVVSGLTLGIGYLLVAFREDKRALHDLIAGTRVVFKPR